MKPRGKARRSQNTVTLPNLTYLDMYVPFRTALDEIHVFDLVKMSIWCLLALRHTSWLKISAISVLVINHDSLKKKTKKPIMPAQVFYVELWVGLNIRETKRIIPMHQLVG